MPKKMVLKNYMEDCVWELLDQVLAQNPEVCCCETCRYDIAALALNQLPPRYTVREKGTLFSKLAMLEVQYRADVCQAIARAIEKVRHSPRHNDK